MIKDGQMRRLKTDDRRNSLKVLPFFSVSDLPVFARTLDPVTRPHPHRTNPSSCFEARSLL